MVYVYRELEGVTASTSVETIVMSQIATVSMYFENVSVFIWEIVFLTDSFEINDCQHERLCSLIVECIWGPWNKDEECNCKNNTLKLVRNLLRTATNQNACNETSEIEQTCLCKGMYNLS